MKRPLFLKKSKGRSAISVEYILLDLFIDFAYTMFVGEVKMIRESTIVEMVERLEYFVKLCREGKQCIDKRFLNYVDSLIFDVRMDIDNNQYAFDGLVAKGELDDANHRIEQLEDEVSELQNELDEC